MTISILFLGGAKRVAVAKMFERACSERGIDCRITGYELSRRSALACCGEIVEGLRWSDPALTAHLEDVVKSKNVDIVLPFVDTAVGIAAELSRATGVFAPVSPGDVANAMFDKVAAARVFESAGVPVPATYKPGMPVGKLIAKPRFGSASKGIVEINTLAELRDLDSRCGDGFLIQERIDNRQEITVDCYAGMRDGVIAACSARVRKEVSGGEAVRTETIADEQAVALARRTIEAAGLRGAVTVQLIRDLDTERLMVMEVNPRLGGGVVASVHAGADIPGLIIDDFLGRSLEFRQAVPGVETVRYLADVVFYPENK